MIRRPPSSTRTYTLCPSTSRVRSLVGVDWEDDVDPRWTCGAATPIDAVSAYREKIGRTSELDRQATDREKTGVFIGSYAINPVNEEPIPIDRKSTRLNSSH